MGTEFYLFMLKLNEIQTLKKINIQHNKISLNQWEKKIKGNQRTSNMLHKEEQR